MALSTAAAIRDRIAVLTEAIVPAVLPADLFLRHRDEGPFIEWVLANPGASLRRFQVRAVTGRDEVIATTGAFERIRRDFDLLVAYPIDNRSRSAYEGGALASTDDLIESDFRQLEYAIGQRGNSIGNYQDIATVYATTENYDPDGAPVRIASKTLSIEFTRAMS
jgi:hypothetical protein